MVGISGLWIPIVVSAVVVFVMSSLIHMVFQWHKGEYASVPNQDAVADALRPFNIPPGEYHMPWVGSMKEMETPDFQARIKRGPNMTLMVRANEPVNMGRSLGLWFVYCLAVSVFVAYVTGRTNFQGAEYLGVFRVAGAVAFASYVLALWQQWVWFGKSLRYMLTTTLDGLIYALLTAGVFGWLWP